MLESIGVFLLAVSFAIFAISISKLLLQMSSTAANAGKSFEMIETKVDDAIVSLEDTLVKSEVTLIDMSTKLNAVDPVFKSVGQVGESIQLATHTLQDVSQRFAEKNELRGAKPFITTIQFAEFSTALVDSWKKGKRTMVTIKEEG